MKKVLVLGSGREYKSSTLETGFINLESNPELKADLYFDLEDCKQKQIPLPENSLDEIHASHILEHIVNLAPLMEECYRLLKPGGLLAIVCQYYTHEWAWGDPTHVRGINEHTFNFFSQEYLKNSKSPTSRLNVKCNFEVKRVEFIVAEEWKHANASELEFAKRRYNNVITNIYFELVAIKTKLEETEVRLVNNGIELEMQEIKEGKIKTHSLDKIKQNINRN